MQILEVLWKCLDCGLIQSDKIKTKDQEISCFECQNKKNWKILDTK